MGKPVYYASGSNEPGELRGFAKIGHPVGVSAPKCRPACERELLRLADAEPTLRLFVDSGAFSEVTPRGTAGPPEVTAPITDAEWKKRLAFMGRLAKAYGPRALLIAPDQVGSQEVTLERLAKYRKVVEQWRRDGAEVAVVLQRGSDPQWRFDQKAKRALNWGGYVVAFPMAKAATPQSEIEAFLRRRRPRRIHLLGLGIEGKSTPAILAAIAKRAPKTRVSLDSVAISGKVGRTGGRGGGPRPYTRAQDVAAEEIRAEALSGLEQTYGTRKLPREQIDLTEEIGRPSDWIELVATRKPRDHGMGYSSVAAWAQAEARLTPAQAEAFAADPDGFLQLESPLGVPWWEHPLLDEALDQAWPRWVKMRTVQLRRERGIEPVWGQHAVSDLPLFRK